MERRRLRPFEQHFRGGCWKSLPPAAILTLQEMLRDKVGWSKLQQGSWSVVSCQPEHMWRGTAVAFRDTEWIVVKRVQSDKGVWVRLKHLLNSTTLWVGTAHFTPGCTFAQYEAEVDDFLAGLPTLLWFFNVMPTLPFTGGCVTAQLRRLDGMLIRTSFWVSCCAEGLIRYLLGLHNIAHLPAGRGNKVVQGISLISWCARGGGTQAVDSPCGFMSRLGD